MPTDPKSSEMKSEIPELCPATHFVAGVVYPCVGLKEHPGAHVFAIMKDGKFVEVAMYDFDGI